MILDRERELNYDSRIYIIRNPILAYRGLGNGILRALKAYPHIDFVDDRDGNLFKVIIKRN